MPGYVWLQVNELRIHSLLAPSSIMFLGTNYMELVWKSVFVFSKRQTLSYASFENTIGNFSIPNKRSLTSLRVASRAPSATPSSAPQDAHETHTIKIK